MSDNALSIRDLTVRFDGGRVTGLDRVSLDVPAGASTVVLGQSGSGKSTLLRVVAGLHVADSGTVTLGDRVLSNPAVRVAPENRGVGMVFQALELWPHMTVAEHIAFGLPGRPQGRSAQSHQGVQRLVRDVGLPPELLGRRPDTLSGGERQRVAIARTLAAGPAVICYDEPLASLDPAHRSSLRRLIRRLAATHGTTILYVTHDADEALEMGTEIVVLEQGRVVERGSSEALVHAPQTLAGARAIGRVSTLPATLVDGRITTALGPVEVSDAQRAEALCSAGDAHAIIRPEQLRAGSAGPSAVVEASRPAGTGWRFTADLDGQWLEGVSAEPLVVGDAVSLSVQDPVRVVSGSTH